MTVSDTTLQPMLEARLAAYRASVARRGCAARLAAMRCMTEGAAITLRLRSVSNRTDCPEPA